jgi:hypothetical protein
MIEQTRKNFERAGELDVFGKVKVTADNGCHSADSVKYLLENGIDAYVPDQGYRKRDPAFVERDRYKERHRKERELEKRKKHGGCRRSGRNADFLNGRPGTRGIA